MCTMVSNEMRQRASACGNVSQVRQRASLCARSACVTVRSVSVRHRVCVTRVREAPDASSQLRVPAWDTAWDMTLSMLELCGDFFSYG